MIFGSKGEGLQAGSPWPQQFWNMFRAMHAACGVARRPVPRYSPRAGEKVEESWSMEARSLLPVMRAE